ncbi:hypothetical protein BGZ46_001964 [Entomortierella lignicola]|nr:hypothetical protein BGZ46_001964 [Entomortierella lignicola]
MAHIRTPIATKVRGAKHWRTTPRCLVVTLSVSFIAFNWIVLHTLKNNTTDSQPIDSSSSLDSVTQQPYVWSGSSSGDHSYKDTPDWFSHWLRWRSLDVGFNLQSTDPLRFDIIYTWVNGSDPDLQDLRQNFQANSSVYAKVGNPKDVSSATAKRFRDMDELRYSFRSIADYARDMYRNIHLLVTEVKPGQGQIPDWLSPDLDRVRPVPHSAIFQNSSHLPSFNSLSIESQMHHIPGITDIFMYMNDDVFLGTTMLPSDIWTPLYGFVFHLEGSLRVPPTIRPTESNPLNVGEWSSLQYSNYLLSQRFGARHRAYIAHVPHVLSVSMVKEIQSHWPNDIIQTSSHRFRGEGEGRDIQMSFFMAHYVLERLRETQLESYWLYRLDKNQDGSLAWDERESLIHLVQSWNRNQMRPDSLKERHARPTMIAGYERILRRVGIPVSGSTIYQLAGLDGYPFLIKDADTSKTIPTVEYEDEAGNKQAPQVPYMRYERPQERTCQLNLEFCFGRDFLDPTKSIPGSQSRSIFKRLASEEFHCGDCLLEILMQHTETGMSAWMPTDENSQAYKEVVNKVSRYNYVLGTSDYSFLALQDEEGARKNLEVLLSSKNKAFFCINDDFPDDPTLQNNIYGIFKKFLDDRFPIASPWEK